MPAEELGAGMGSADHDLQNVPILPILLESCLDLARVEASSSTVRLAHFVLQEHLSSDQTLFHFPCLAIAEVYLTYINAGYC